MNFFKKRSCKFKDFPVHEVSELAERVCGEANTLHADGVIIGQRNLSKTQKFFLSSGNFNKKNHCDNNLIKK